jgi:hypothetical protein
MSKRPYRCPVCRRRAHTRPKAMLHLWSHALADELDMPFAEVEETLNRHLAERLVSVDARTGDLVGRWSAMGEFGEKVREAVLRIEEENKQEREERRARVQQELRDIRAQRQRDMRREEAS